MRFVEFWHDVAGRDPQWLYFDSKLVPYAELARVNERHIWFVTIRRRGAAILRRLHAVPAKDWRGIFVNDGCVPGSNRSGSGLAINGVALIDHKLTAEFKAMSESDITTR